MRSPLASLLRFGIVGVASNLLLYAGYLALTYGGAAPKVAMTAMYVTGVVLTFVVHRDWSFRVVHRVPGAFSRYLTVYLIGYFVNYVALVILVDHMRLQHQTVQAVLILVVAALVFLLQRKWVFRSAGVAPHTQ